MTTTYTIQAGDNLTKIAERHNTTVESLARLNKISDPNKITAGQTIKLVEDARPTQTPQVETTYEDLSAQLEQAQTELSSLQEQMNEQGQTNIDGFDMFGTGLAIYGSYKVGEKFLPKLWNVTKQTSTVVANTAKTTGQAVANASQNAASQVGAGVKHFAKKVELEYAFGKDAVIKTGKKATKFVHKTNVRSTRILNGQQTTINGTTVKPLGKFGKVLGRAAVPITIVTSAAEVGAAYERGGIKEATKTGAKCATGMAAGWAGAKVGAAIGTAICPGVGTAVGAFAGGIVGYFLGEKAAEKVIG